ncbi:hypothetical protein [Sphingomonas phage Carli]|nr:hypothetical protein [Sphingomonas phage Carli]
MENPMLQTLIQWSHNHPLLAFLVGWVTLGCLTAVPFLIRGWRRRTGDDLPQQRYRADGSVVQPRELQLRLEDRITPELERVQEALGRIPMHNRFMPPHATGVARALSLADQIVADQQQAHEEPGKPTTAPAPGEPGYQEPDQTIRVVVDAFTVVLTRGQPPVLLEAKPDGSDYPAVVIPEPWDDVMTALAFEVQRLREGWSVK